MSNKIHPQLTASTRYVAAIVCFMVALVVRLALDPILAVRAAYLPFALSVIAAARLGGRGPGILATALSAAGIAQFFAHHTYPGTLAGMLVFIPAGIVISLLVGRWRESLISAARSREALRVQAQLIDLSHDAIITADPNQVITGWNAGAVEVYGWSASEALGKVSHDLLHTRTSIPREEIDRILSRDGRWDGELERTTRDGRKIVVESRRILLRDHRQNPVGCLIIERDVTERKRAEEELREAAEYRRLTLEAASFGSWDYRFETRETVCDARCLVIFGMAAGDPVDYERVLARVHAEDRDAIEEAVKQAIAGVGGGLFHRECRVVWPDSSVHWVASHGRVFFEDHAGRRAAVRFVGVSSDVTARRQGEERLRQAQKLESVGMLAGGIAHDFNNLLTVIMGSASIGLQESPPCAHCKTILRSSQRAAHLTRQLLAYAGKGHHVSELVSLTEVILEAKTLLLASLPKKVRLEFDLQSDLPMIETDPSLLEQILVNLVVNAGEAIPPQTDGRIHIATSRSEVTQDAARLHSVDYDVAAGPYVSLAVRDNGCGMDAATAARIFEPFFTTKFMGRGLGLAAVHGIVRALGGFIQVETAPGAGSTFHVWLPASEKTRPPEQAGDAGLPQPDHAPAVLVVDDEELVRRLACEILRRYGYDTMEAQNGRDALRVLEHASPLPPLVLLDLAMPVMGGDELVPVLEARYPQLRVLVTSGYPEEEIRKVFPSGSVAGFIQKPYTALALAEKVGEVLHSRTIGDLGSNVSRGSGPAPGM